MSRSSYLTASNEPLSKSMKMTVLYHEDMNLSDSVYEEAVLDHSCGFESGEDLDCQPFISMDEFEVQASDSDAKENFFATLEKDNLNLSATIRDYHEDVDTDGTIPQEYIAEQKAATLAAEFNDRDGLKEVLSEIFMDGCHGQTVKAVRRLLNQGASSDALWLAWQTRLVWRSYPEFSSGKKQSLSWNTAFRIANSFSGYPEIEEIELLLLELYGIWETKSVINRGYIWFQAFINDLFQRSSEDCWNQHPIVPDWFMPEHFGMETSRGAEWQNALKRLLG